jgi:glycosyltransferase involved in cell wall biosynthesis
MVDLVSVCIPAWNEERSIGTTLESVLAQSRRNIEVLVCANACTDRTAEVVRDYEGRDSRVRLIETPERGKPNAWNILMRESQSNYVVFCDADVFLEPEAVEAICRRLEKDDKTGITGVINYICRDSDHLTQLLFLKNEKNFIPTKDYFCGGLYGINKKRLLERMRQFGLDKMPNEIITDDFF